MNRAEQILSKVTGWDVDAIQTDGPPIRPSNALEAMKQIAWEAHIKTVKDYCRLFETSYNESQEKEIFEQWYNKQIEP